MSSTPLRVFRWQRGRRRTLRAAGLTLALVGAVGACTGALPLECARGISLENCRRAYTLADAELTAEQHPTAVWVGLQCPSEECSPLFVANKHILVVFRLPDGPVAVVVERPQWRAVRYEGELSNRVWQ
jgi:hypothetical protein